MTIHARDRRRPKPTFGLPVASPIAAQFDLQIRALHLPRPLREFRFHPTRKWRIDFAWPDMLLAVEIEGEVHRIKDRFHADLLKYAELTLREWTLLRVGGREVRSGIGIQWLQALLWVRTPLGLSRAFETGAKRPPAAPIVLDGCRKPDSTFLDTEQTAANDALEAFESQKRVHEMGASD